MSAADVNISRKGVTLIELLCVISIIGIVAGAFHFSGRMFWANIKLRYATRELISNLRYAKICAVSMQGATIRVAFHEDPMSGDYDSYRIMNMGNLAHPTIKQIKLVRGVSIDKAQSTFDHTLGYIEFHYNGSLDAACTIVLKDIDNEKSRQVTLTIGYTRVMETSR